MNKRCSPKYNSLGAEKCTKDEITKLQIQYPWGQKKRTKDVVVSLFETEKWTKDEISNIQDSGGREINKR